jgi:predicted transcriptional regulator
MTGASQLGKQAAGLDPGVGLRAAAELRRLGEELELAQVKRARELGWSWREIANRLDLTKQAVHQRYAALVEEGQ